MSDTAEFIKQNKPLIHGIPQMIRMAVFPYGKPFQIFSQYTNFKLIDRNRGEKWLVK